MKIDATAAIIPPMRQLIRRGATFEKSKAGETKFATMLIPMVAIVKVIAPRITPCGRSIRPTVPTGQDRAGSSIDTATYHSLALGATGSFHVYLPPGYA